MAQPCTIIVLVIGYGLHKSLEYDKWHLGDPLLLQFYGANVVNQFGSQLHGRFAPVINDS